MLDGLDILRARISDFALRSEKGELCVSQFLSPSECAYAKRFLSEQGLLLRTVFFGGFEEAERQALFVLPAYTEDFSGSTEEKLSLFFQSEKEEAVRALKISGSTYRELSHKDYLGSILALGLEREVLGDIVVTDDYSAVIFCSGKISEFIRTSLERVANDAVEICDFTPDEGFCPKHEYKRINGTVASARLDCIVGALTNLSREKSQELIKKELCQLNYITEDRCDTIVTPPAILSLRGYGKYALRELDGKTKSGRIRLSADKYI